MEPLKIIKDNNKLLREKSIDVTIPLSSSDEETINKMLEYLKSTQNEEYREKYKNKKVREGVGLAAPQIGILKKMLVIHYIDKDKEITHALINPKIISTSATKCYLHNGEGCLSVDEDRKGYVFRYNRIKLSAYDYLKKENVIITARGYEAVVLQHEIDHLSGILYYDRINQFDPFKILEGSIEL